MEIAAITQMQSGYKGWPEAYVRQSTRGNKNGSMAAWLSPQMDDPAWDEFLQNCPFGQYQQSSRWAKVKAVDGWEPIRIVFSLDRQVVGGFQMLVRRGRMGKIGYISKGPALALEDYAWANFAIEALFSTVRQHGLQAVLLQPPDRSKLYERWLPARQPLLANHLTPVIESTLLVDLSEGMEAIRRRMRKRTRLEIRQAEERGIRIREGGERDIGTFFRLMAATCERQRTRPNPASERALLEVWRGFHGQGCARLMFSEFQGKPVAGLFSLGFGDTATCWKRGWSGDHRDLHPNQPLTLDAIEWAHRMEYKFFDFCSLRPDIAAAMLQGQPLSEDQRKSRDYVNLNYGNLPVILPESRVYFRNPLARAVYRIAIKIPPLRDRLRRLG
jgi:lipid II:glycine glycyltransferase (peptidoglycan interpeptide bridge formation enzyme)